MYTHSNVSDTNNVQCLYIFFNYTFSELRWYTKKPHTQTYKIQNNWKADLIRVFREFRRNSAPICSRDKCVMVKSCTPAFRCVCEQLINIIQVRCVKYRTYCRLCSCSFTQILYNTRSIRIYESLPAALFSSTVTLLPLGAHSADIIYFCDIYIFVLRLCQFNNNRFVVDLSYIEQTPTKKTGWLLVWHMRVVAKTPPIYSFGTSSANSPNTFRCFIFALCIINWRTIFFVVKFCLLASCFYHTLYRPTYTIHW